MSKDRQDDILGGGPSPPTPWSFTPFPVRFLYLACLPDWVHATANLVAQYRGSPLYTMQAERSRFNSMAHNVQHHSLSRLDTQLHVMDNLMTSIKPSLHVKSQGIEHLQSARPSQSASKNQATTRLNFSSAYHSLYPSTHPSQNGVTHPCMQRHVHMPDLPATKYQPSKGSRTG